MIPINDKTICVKNGNLFLNQVSKIFQKMLGMSEQKRRKKRKSCMKIKVKRLKEKNCKEKDIV